MTIESVPALLRGDVEVPRYALRSSADVVIINPDMTGQPTGLRIPYLIGAAGTILPELVRVAYANL
jgi:hypothetical protein